VSDAGRGQGKEPVSTAPGATTRHAVAQLALLDLDLFEVAKPARGAGHARSPDAGPRQRRRKRRRRRTAGQVNLPFPHRLLVRDNLRPVRDHEVPVLPATRERCLTDQNPRVAGICPVFRCKYNLALWVKDNGAIKVEGTGDDTRNQTLRSHRRVSKGTIEKVADRIIARARRLGISLCTLDLADAIADERVRLRTMKKDAADEPDWTYALIARILGVSAERARVLGTEAVASLKAKMLAAGLAPDGADASDDDDDQADAADGELDELLLVPTPPASPPRASTAPLVQIRRRPSELRK
jgi:hypothetical protein